MVLDLDMAVRLVRANSHVRCDAGRVAVMRGPLVYCAEQADNAGDLWTYRLADGVDVADATVTFESDLLGGVDAVTLPAVREAADAVDAPLYMSAQRDASDERTVAQAGALLRMGQPRTRPNERVVAQLNKRKTCYPAL